MINERTYGKPIAYLIGKKFFWKNEFIVNKDVLIPRPDTEVIIEAYKYWGLDCLKKFRGMFAFAIWDNIKKELILARDPFGIKPLYYSKKNNIL